VDSNSPCKDLCFLRGPNLAQKPLYLEGSVRLKYVVHVPRYRLLDNDNSLSDHISIERRKKLKPK